MTQRMTSERIPTEEDDIRCEQDRPDAYSELCRARRRVGEPHRFPRIVREKDEKDQREVEEVPVNVLDDERKRIFAKVSFTRLADSAARRVSPERLVVRAAVVVAREAKSCRERQDDQRRGERKKCRPPAWLRTEPAGGRIAEQQRRVERREVVPVLVMRVLESGPGCVCQKT